MSFLSQDEHAEGVEIDAALRSDAEIDRARAISQATQVKAAENVLSPPVRPRKRERALKGPPITL